MQNRSNLSTYSGKKPFTVKIASWSARHRWIVFGLWFVFIIGLMVGSSFVPQSATDRDVYAGLDFETAKASKVLKDNGGEANPNQKFFLIVSNPNLKATDPAFQETVGKMVEELNTYNVTQDGQSKPLFSQLLNPYQVPPQAGLISEDGTTVRIYGQIPSESNWQKMKEKIEPFAPKIKELKGHYPEYKVLASNVTLDYLEANADAQESLNHSLLITLIPTFVILLVVFGAFVASIVPLILALTAIIGAIGILTAYSRFFGDKDISTAMTLMVLMGLAVAVDYSLFVISRYRSERRKGRDKLDAIEVACGTAGRAVFFSGLLVAISISGLFILGSLFVPMALGVIAVVLMAVLGSMTFLPAMLAILGKGINWGRIPYFGREREEGKGVWSAIVHAVMRRPVVTTLVAVSLLVGLASPLLHIRLGITQSDSDKLESQQAAKVMNEKWPQGTSLTMLVVITKADQPETQAAMKQFEAAALQVPNINGPVEIIPSKDGKVAVMTFLQAGSWNDQKNQDAVTKIRKEVIPANLKTVNGVEAYVMGMSAEVIDESKFFMNPTVWVFVLGLSFLVLLLVFRSLVIGVKAIILNLLSTCAAYGIVILVFQDGWLGVKPTGVMEVWLPVFIFAIVFGLSMDYHMFILTRIKELRDKGYDSNQAVAEGISITSGTITGAAAIMVVVFGDFFIGLDDPSVRQLGLGLAVAVFLDATIVRSMLLPAVMRLMGEFNWWMPAFLNWLPTITIESEVEELPAVSVVEEAEKEMAVA